MTENQAISSHCQAKALSFQMNKASEKSLLFKEKSEVLIRVE